VLDQQIEVMSSTGDVLRYDKPVGDEGLTWDELQAWWAELQGLANEDAKRSLWQRLRAAIPAESPPQRALFEQYHEIYGKRNRLIALLPEVWLHWDPVTKRQRGAEALPTQRMDFLMLLPGRRRVVLEVDGAQHYSEAGRPSPSVYAQTVRDDRDLRLSRYEVYRFSGHELLPQHARGTVSSFFERLLGGSEQQ
jgi:very-short-patch-repair endonuclease